MGYLDNSSVTIDAILTTKGRELLAQGGRDFVITKFALGDDEIDYTLWNSNHPLGSAYYGIIIENMPVLEATPDETQALRSKLLTLPKGTQKLPVLGNITITAGDLKSRTDVNTIAPTTSIGGTIFSETYTVTVNDSTVLTLSVTAPAGAAITGLADSLNIADAHSISGIGTSFTIKATGTDTVIRKATVQILGNSSGVTTTIPYTVQAFT